MAKAFIGMTMLNKDTKELIDYIKTLVIPGKLSGIIPEQFIQNPDFLELDAAIKSIQNSVKELKLAQENFELGFQMMNEAAIIITMEEGQLVAYNKAFADVIKIREEEILDENARVPDLYFELDKRVIEELKESGFCNGLEMEIAVNNENEAAIIGLVSSRVINMKGKPHVLIIIKDISERRRLEEEIKLLSITDKLTQVYNRIKIDEILERELERSERTERPFAIILVDIDSLKMVNETYGNQIGDTVIVEYAKIIKENVRSIDIVGRWNGEEFLILLPDTDKDGAIVLAEKLRVIIDDFNFTKVGKLTASFGIAEYKKDLLPANIVSRADLALNKAKDKGRNQIEIF
ncbi:diguanylate cyclase [Acetobacterium paludosum]|uniref:Diguanylate cyclase n=2 Tax=Acetobacterium paludosum TaxID=52693 RepID=A0A923I0W0_9FIRM|nr:diguanylate cyclase [Acetobacterium paludosum]